MRAMTTPATEPDYGGQVIDLSLLNVPALEALAVSVRATLEHRATLAQAMEEAEALAHRFLTARDKKDPVAGGEPPADSTGFPAWVAPTGIHDAYPPRYRVSHNGKLWYSLTPANTWEPGVSGWREFFAEPAEGGDPPVPEWVAPSGAHDAYQRGEQVRFEERRYESVIDGNVHSPEVYPPGWEDVTPAEEVITEPTPEPAPDPTAGVPAWVEGTVYQDGERVSYAGGVYESLTGDNTAVPADDLTNWVLVAGSADPTPAPEPTPEPEPAPSYPEFVQPTGSTDAYQIGDRVTFEGDVWESTIANNVWSPNDYPQGWTLVTA